MTEISLAEMIHEKNQLSRAISSGKKSAVEVRPRLLELSKQISEWGQESGKQYRIM